MTGGSDSNLNRPDDAPDYIHPDRITTRSKRKRLDEDVIETVSNQLLIFKEEMMNMLKDWRAQDESKQIKWDQTLNEIKTTTQELEKSMTFLSTQVDEQAVKLIDLEKHTKVQDETISALKSEVEHLRRESRKSFMEIRNLPVETKESKDTLTTSVLALCKTIKTDISAAEIKDIYRIPGKRDVIKPVIIELSTNEKKLSILKDAKSYNIQNKDLKLNAQNLGFNQNSPIYVSDHLTPFANRLHFLARDLVKSKLYKYCWTVNGKVYVKKSDDSSSILIQSESQIHQLKSGDPRQV